jgi:hypothetical protein
MYPNQYEMKLNLGIFFGASHMNIHVHYDQDFIERFGFILNLKRNYFDIKMVLKQC